MREFCPILDGIISMKNTLSEKETVSVFVVPEEKHLTSDMD